MTWKNHTQVLIRSTTPIRGRKRSNKSHDGSWCSDWSWYIYICVCVFMCMYSIVCMYINFHKLISSNGSDSKLFCSGGHLINNTGTVNGSSDSVQHVLFLFLPNYLPFLPHNKYNYTVAAAPSIDKYCLCSVSGSRDRQSRALLC